MSRVCYRLKEEFDDNYYRGHDGFKTENVLYEMVSGIVEYQIIHYDPRNIVDFTVAKLLIRVYLPATDNEVHRLWFLILREIKDSLCIGDGECLAYRFEPNGLLAFHTFR